MIMNNNMVERDHSVINQMRHEILNMQNGLVQASRVPSNVCTYVQCLCMYGLREYFDGILSR